MTNKQPDIEEQIKEILKPVDDIIITQAARGYPYTGGNLVLAILNLVAQREQQAYRKGREHALTQLKHEAEHLLLELKELEQNK